MARPSAPARGLLFAMERCPIIAVLTLPVYVSGVAAYYEIRERPDISVDNISIHQDAALIGFTVMEFAGFVGWVALWQSRRRGHARSRTGPYY